jgi:hypothetical protein
MLASYASFWQQTEWYLMSIFASQFSPDTFNRFFVKIKPAKPAHDEHCQNK